MEVRCAELDLPEHLKWYLTQEGRDKADDDMKVVADLIKQAMEIFEKYGFQLKCEIVDLE